MHYKDYIHHDFYVYSPVLLTQYLRHCWHTPCTELYPPPTPKQLAWLLRKPPLPCHRGGGTIWLGGGWGGPCSYIYPEMGKPFLGLGYTVTMVFQIWVYLKMGYTQKWPLNHWENDDNLDSGGIQFSDKAISSVLQVFVDETYLHVVLLPSVTRPGKRLYSRKSPSLRGT